ncbi:hypothetical protein DFH27DRAFT_653198 [Peziza echinospora]|nr:hypothetical protein DFH27DRAFT_604914 [Peziza echinospora]KAI5800201.1 hypothetical protein DFH27DRAFT_653198 [Peziza echinospora]
MTELSFAKQFLVAVSSRPVKFAADYADDQRNYPARTPITLPKPSRLLPKRPRLDPPPTTTITIKTLRAPHLTLPLPPLPLNTTTILTVKLLVSEHTSIPIPALKILQKGKILADPTFLREVVPEGTEAGAGVVLNVMFMGGAVPKGVEGEEQAGEKMDVDSTSSPVVDSKPKEGEGEKMDVEQQEGEEPSTKEEDVLSTPEFWEDLRGWVSGRVGKGTGTAVTPVDVDAVIGLWKEAWEERKKKKSAA